MPAIPCLPVSYTHLKLILAPGAEPVVPPIPGLDPERVMTLRTIPDARRIRAFLEQRRPRRAVIVGGGAIGLEMAENLLRTGLSVAIAEAADHVIAGLDYDAACDVHRYLRRQGVELHLADGVKAVSYTHLDVYKRQSRSLAEAWLLRTPVRQ